MTVINSKNDITPKGPLGYWFIFVLCWWTQLLWKRVSIYCTGWIEWRTLRMRHKCGTSVCSMPHLMNII